MVRHLFLLLAAASLIIGCMFYPFLPGDYDGLAVSLSVMSQLFGMAGLVLVPLGVVWLVYELKMRAAGPGTPSGTNFGYWFGFASICAWTLVAVVVSLGATVDHHFSLGVGVLALWAYCAFRLAAKLKKLRNAADRKFNPAPLYLVVLPLVAAIFKFTLVAPASELSRNRAIDESASLISDIERYRDTHGHYPRSLQSLWDDYRPSVIGIKRYHYEPNGDFYNVYFEHFSVALDIKEIVMYNKQGDHQFTNHNADLLQFSPPDLDRMRGYISVHNAARANWKYFLFD